MTENFTAPLSRGQMGRPALGLRSANIRLADEDRARIVKLVGKKGMAKFIREAIKRELEVREKEPQKKKGR